MALPLTLLALTSFPEDLSGQILYLLHKGETQPALHRYLEHSKRELHHDFALLQQAGLRLLENGVESDDPEIQLMCMFGAGVAMSEELLPILEKGLKSDHMKTQLTALSYLGRLSDDTADKLIVEALSSPMLLTRLEACFMLAKKNHPIVLGHLQSLMVKVPDLARVLFPQIAIFLEGREADAYMRRLLTDANLEVRKEAILTVARAKRDDFLPQIRSLAGSAQHALQESCALALGELRDSHSIPILLKLLESPRRTTRYAAAIALHELGDQKTIGLIADAAKTGDLFAIAALGALEEKPEVLQPLVTHSDRDVRLNATLALLAMRDCTALATIDEVLFQGAKDIGFVQITSPGGGLKAWRTTASAHQQTKRHPAILSQTTGLRAQTLTQALELPQKAFERVAHLVMESHETTLIPLLVKMLENKQMIDLLKACEQQAGVPLLRNYATLALYRLKQEGDYEEKLIKWVRTASNHEMIQFQDEEPRWATHYALTPQERSSFLVEVFETLASAQNRAGIEALLHALAYGNPKNRYALAGLLLRTTE